MMTMSMKITITAIIIIPIFTWAQVFVTLPSESTIVCISCKPFTSPWQRQ